MNILSAGTHVPTDQLSPIGAADPPDAGFDTADLTTFCRLDELGLVVTGQRLEPDRAVLACRVVEPL